MDYQYEGSGGISVGGCAETTATRFYFIDFPIGTVAYLKYRAAKGTLEKIVVKEALLTDINRSFSDRVQLYKDTYNFLYNLSELCTYDEAVALIEAYEADQLRRAKEKALKCY